MGIEKTNMRKMNIVEAAVYFFLPLQECFLTEDLRQHIANGVMIKNTASTHQ
jgi:hypothetical protein